MGYPSLEQYNEALQSPHLAILDPELKKGVLTTTGLGLPLALCGGFALTYTVMVGNKKYALRCFHRESRDLERRYQAIAARVKQLASPYFLPFEFIPNGIRIQGSTFPIVKMEWANGTTLAEFLAAEYHNSTALKKLRSALGSLAEFLEQNTIAHGDIQPENIMVSHDGSTVQLIDYDGMYVEALKGSQAAELGQINFQHPKRSQADFNHHLDRFSFIVLDVALQALIASPNIWGSSQSEPGAIIFRRYDFLNPGGSAIFGHAAGISGIRAPVESLGRVALGSFGSVPKLSDFLLGRGVPAGSIKISTTPATSVYQSAYPVCDATDFGSLKRLVGSRVELLGKVHSVKQAWAKNRKPYVFVNFSDWRGQAVKLAIWSDGLNLLGINAPNESWVGSWVSVTGLVDPPYSNSVRGVRYTHLSITISSAGQIQRLSKQQAEFRLLAIGSPMTVSQSTTSSRNLKITDGMGGTGKTRTSPPIARVNQQPKSAPLRPSVSRNKNIAQAMRKSTPSTVSQSQRRTSPTPSQPSRPSRQGSEIWTWIIGGFFALILLRACGG